MPTWLTSLLFAVLVVTIPFTWILKILLQLPRPVATCHRKWPLPLNFALIGLITAYVTIFIRSAYYGGRSDPASVMTQFSIAALAYAFVLVLLLRQFSGVYADFIVTTGRSGLSLKKTVYRNISDVQRISETRGETRLRIKTSYGASLFFTLPTRDVPIFYERMRAQITPEISGPHR